MTTYTFNIEQRRRARGPMTQRARTRSRGRRQMPLGFSIVWRCCLAAGLGPVPLAQAQSLDIPLQLAESSQGVRLIVNVGIAGQAPLPYLFDTGSNVFNAEYSASAFGSVPSSMGAPTAQFPNGLPTGVKYSYGDSANQTNAFYANYVGVPSLTFYSTSTGAGSAGGVTLNATTPTGQASSFIVGAVYSHVNGTTTVTGPLEQYKSFGGYYGIFGAGNFTTQESGNASSQAGITQNTTTTTVGGVLGQSVVAGTTSGYVVAANGQALKNLGPTSLTGSAVNGPQVGQSVTSCSPCVMLGLTPALLAQFKPVNTVKSVGTSQPFPNSGASATRGSSTPLNYTLTPPNSPGDPTVTVKNRLSLLDTGTLGDIFASPNGDPSYTLTSGTIASISVANAGAKQTVDTLYQAPQSCNSHFTGRKYGTCGSPYTATYKTANVGNIIGVGFFLQNSVLYNLAGQVVGYTPNFVTDTNITTTPAAPLTIDGSSVPLGLAGVISGSGGVAINAGGSATLSGTNTYTGATSVNSGMLAIVGPGSIAASSGVNVTSNGLFDISGTTQGTTIAALAGDSTGGVTLGRQTLTIATAASTFAGVVSGAGGLTLNGGTQVLSGANTYTGKTTINGATLAIVGQGSIASSEINVASNGLFDISGTTQGTTIASLAGNFTGGVTLGGQTLTIANAASTFAGVVSGPGGLTLNGGTQGLTGANSYMGATTINGGTLEVDGSLASTNVTVNAGGTLSGIGTIGDPVIGPGGTLAPGTATALGRLTINGPLTFAAGSNYNVRVTPTANASALVNGAVTIAGGTVNVIAAKTSFPLLSRFDILTATGGIHGAFSGVTSNLAFLTPLLSQDASNVYLTLLSTAATAAGTPDYRSAAATQNQRAVAGALTTAGLGAPNAPLLAALNGTTLAQAQGAFDTISGEGISGADTSALMQSQMFSGAMADQATLWLNGGGGGNEIVLTALPPGALGYAPVTESPIVVHDQPAPVRTWRAWASGFGADATLHSLGQTTGAAAQTDTIYGGAAGLDYQVDPILLVGIAGGGSSGMFDVAGRATSGLVTGGHIGVYGVLTSGAFYGLSTLSGSFFRDTETRLVPGFGDLAGGSEQGGTDARATRARIEVGRRFADMIGATVTPFVALEVADLHTDGFTEMSPSSASAFALNVGGHDTASVPGFIGLRLEHTYMLADGITLKPVASLAYGHDFAPQRGIVNALVALPNAPFEVAGAPLARDFAETKIGTELALAANAALSADFDGDFSGREQIYGGKGGVKISW